MLQVGGDMIGKFLVSYVEWRRVLLQYVQLPLGQLHNPGFDHHSDTSMQVVTLTLRYCGKMDSIISSLLLTILRTIIYSMNLMCIIVGTSMGSKQTVPPVVLPGFFRYELLSVYHIEFIPDVLMLHQTSNNFNILMSYLYFLNNIDTLNFFQTTKLNTF